ncbi:MAG: GHKL domain-containing protein [Cytophagales bacterium]|nr:GHKL domain-containing protein [Cytophagales bacterium]
MSKSFPNTSETMDSPPMGDLNEKTLEHKIFLFISNIGFIVTFILLTLDVLLFKSTAAIVLDAVAMVSFGIFWYLGRQKNYYQKLAAPLAIEILAIVTIGWIVGKGTVGTTNWSLYSLIASASIAMLSVKERKMYLTVLFFTMIGLCVFDYFYAVENLYKLSISPIQNLFNFTYGCVILLAEIVIVSYIKNRYIQERELNQKQLRIINSNAYELEVQNEELSQQNEEITSQRDIIEAANSKLLDQSIELSMAKDKIEEYNSNLEKMVQDRTNEVLMLNKELDLFMYRSSHDFRGPMMTLQGLTKVAQLINTSEEHLELWKKAEQTIGKVDRMLDKFVMISEINYFDEFEPQDLVKCIEALRNKYKSEQIDLQIATIISLANYVTLDRRNKLIAIILDNVLENAVLYRKRISKTIITLDLYEDGQVLHLKIKDNGLGIPSEIIPKVTQMYFRGHENSIGNGLGLYVVKSAVNKLNGSMEIDSQEGEYTKISISFPI